MKIELHTELKNPLPKTADLIQSLNNMLKDNTIVGEYKHVVYDDRDTYHFILELEDEIENINNVLFRMQYDTPLDSDFNIYQLDNMMYKEILQWSIFSKSYKVKIDIGMQTYVSFVDIAKGFDIDNIPTIR